MEILYGVSGLVRFDSGRPLAVSSGTFCALLSFLSVYGCRRGPMAGAVAPAYRLAGCKSQFDSGTDGQPERAK